MLPVDFLCTPSLGLQMAAVLLSKLLAFPGHAANRGRENAAKGICHAEIAQHGAMRAR